MWLVGAGLLALTGCSSTESPRETLKKAQLALQTPVAAFGFDESTGNAIEDDSGNGHNTTLSGQTRVTGKYGDGLEFSGDFLTVPDSSLLDVTTGMTLSAWVYPTELFEWEWHAVLYKEWPPEGGVYALYAHTADDAPAAFFRSSGDPLTIWGQQALAIDTWTHLTATYNATTFRLYVNGDEVAAEPITLPVDTSSGPLRIGGNDVWGEPFYGIIDEVRVYDRALSEAEIEQDMQTPINGGGGGCGSGCSDGNVCNGEETCVSNSCVPGTPLTVDDGNPCTTDACHPTNGVTHTPVANGTSCTDADLCTQTSSCQSGTCTGSNPITCTPLDQCHNAGTCNPATGVCSNPNKPSGTACNDGNACTASDTCQSGSCTSGSAVPTDDGNACTTDACDPQSGVTNTPVAAGTPCLDGNVCNGAEACNAIGFCTAGTPLVTDDGNPCTTDGCHPVNGVTHTPVAAGTACPDGDVCNGAEECNATGVCQAGTPPSVNDGNPCTTDACDSVAGVTHTPVPNGTSCDDSDLCTQTSSCQGGSCAGSNPVVCTALDQCHNAGTCNPATGTCPNPAKPDGTGCNDGNVCTADDICQSGSCTAGSAVATDDGNPCTTDGCDTATGVTHTPVAAGTPCLDQDVCNGSEACNEIGFCAAGTALSTDDGNPCTADSCHPTNGVIHTPVAAGIACPDGNACNGAESCNAGGICTAGTPLATDDGNPCTADACDPVAGVTHTPVTEGTPCPDGNVCNGDEFCDASSECTAGFPLVVDDENPCTTDGCDPIAGVSNDPLPSGATCGPGLTCDGAGHCGEPLPPPPPDPSTIAPALPRAIGVPFADRHNFLYTGPNAIQTPEGTSPLQIDPKRVSVLRGKVVDGEGQPLPSAKVHVLGHPEFGRTLARADGQFDLAVNSGGVLTIAYERPGYFPVHRKIKLRWNELVDLESVTLTRPDAQYDGVSGEPLPSPITCTLGTAGCDVVIHGRTVQDADGVRRASVFMRGDVGATMTLPGGTQQSLGSVTIRATEYTDGTRGGPNAMPAELPTGVAYTYAVELSIDEAVSAGATRVDFKDANNQPAPIPVYFDNFRNFPVGLPVPVGYYDRERGAWIRSESGRIVKIITESGGMARLDLDGDGIAEDPEDLQIAAAQGITAQELQKLAQLHDPGVSLSRVRMTHFTPWDMNYTWSWYSLSCQDGGPCSGDAVTATAKRRPKCPDQQTGSVIDCQARSVGERVPIAGTPYSLNYQSRRAIGYEAERKIEIDFPICLGTQHSIRRAVAASVTYLGGRFSAEASGCTNRINMIPNVLEDRYGRPITGMQTAFVETTEVYPFYYLRSDSFGDGGYSGAQVIGTACGACEERIIRRFSSQFYAYDARQMGLAGWTLNVQHHFDAKEGILELGSGERRYVKSVDARIVTGYPDWSNVDARTLVATPDGGAFLADHSNSQQRIHKMSRDGSLLVPYAGSTSPTAPGWDDDSPHPALNHRFPGRLNALALGPDGSLFLTEIASAGASGIASRIRRIAPDGIMHTVVGAGSTAGGYRPSDDDLGEAFTALLDLAGNAATSSQADIEVADDGTLYIADYGNNRVRRVDTAGGITTIGGNGVSSPTVAGYAPGPAKLGELPGPSRMALGPDGSLYVKSKARPTAQSGEVFVIKRIAPDGTMGVVVGGGTSESWEGALGTDVGGLFEPFDIAVDSMGRLHFIATPRIGGLADNRRIYYLDIEGRVRIAAGGGNPAPSASDVSGVPATSVDLLVSNLTIRPDDSIFATYFQPAPSGPTLWHIHSFEVSGDATCSALVPSHDADEVFCFDVNGRHLKTLDALTRTPVLTFTYEGDSLRFITDASGNATEIQWASPGKPSAIIAPFKQTTTLALDANDYLERVMHPDGTETELQHSPAGLLQEFVDQRGFRSTFAYSEYGELESETLANTGVQTLEEDLSPGGQTNTFTTPEGRQTIYITSGPLDQSRETQITKSPDGTLRRVTRTPDGKTTIENQDGTSVVFASTPDPRFGMTGAYAGTSTVTLPGGPTRQTVRTRTFTDDPDPGDPSIHREMTSINGRPPSRVERKEAKTSSPTAPPQEIWTSSMGRSATVTLDAQGRVALFAPSGVTPREVTYDSAGRLSRVVQGSPGADGRVLRENEFYATGGADPKSGYISRILAGALAANSSTIPALSADTEPDSFGRPLRQTVGGSLTVFGWNGAGELATLIPPEREGHSFVRSPSAVAYLAPAVNGVTFGATTAVFNRDRQIDFISRPDGKMVDYVYNSTTGKLAEVVTDSGTIALSYWPVPDCGSQPFCSCLTVPCGAGSSPGLISSITGPGPVNLGFQYKGQLTTKATAEKHPSGSAETLIKTTLDWTYNAELLRSSERLSFTSAASYNVRSAFGYDNDGLITCIEQDTATSCNVANADAESLTYSSANGMLTSTKLGSIVDAYGYNAFGEIASYEATFTTPATSTLYSVTYDDGSAAFRRDALGRVVRKTEVRDGAPTKTMDFSYDLLGRLATVTENPGNLVRTYNYDANGNRDLPEVTEVYDGQDRLIQLGANTYSYTEAGELREKNTTGLGTVDYAYDTLGNLRLVIFKNTSGTVTKTVDYVVDGLGRRIAKKVNGVLTQQFVYRDALRLAAELDGTGKLRSRFWYGSRNNVPDFMERRTGTTVTLHRIISDQLGSPVMVVNAVDMTQKLVNVSFDEWGNVSGTGIDEIPFGFAGGLYDVDTKLVRFGARDYDPETGRWISKDPILFNGGDANLYSYVWGDPVNFFDEAGLWGTYGGVSLGASYLGPGAGVGFGFFSDIDFSTGVISYGVYGRVSGFLGLGLFGGADIDLGIHGNRDAFEGLDVGGVVACPIGSASGGVSAPSGDFSSVGVSDGFGTGLFAGASLSNTGIKGVQFDPRTRSFSWF